MELRSTCIGIAIAVVLALPVTAVAQNNGISASPAANSNEVDYPKEKVGVLIHGVDWVPLPNENPTKTRVKHGFAPSVTYGIASGAAVSDYDGLHAQLKVESGQPVICLCHVLSLPGAPVLVKLHPMKTYRELAIGKLHIRSKTGEAEKDDLIPVNVSHPESSVWIVQPQQALPTGEYALMLGTQNISIFPFSVAGANPTPPAPGDH